MQFKLILLIILAVSGAVQAQDVKPIEASDDQSQSVHNDDQGRAFIIVGEAPALATLGSQRRILVEPQQHSIFLGSGWGTASLRSREPELANLLVGIRDQTQITSLAERGIRSFFGPTFSQEKLDGPEGERSISDLEIQRMLAEGLKDGSLHRPNASTIYVVFLSPDMSSTLGAMIAGKHYLAYHSFFHTPGMKIHYVVVPFEANPTTAHEIALRAFLVAAFNPSGAGS